MKKATSRRLVLLALLVVALVILFVITALFGVRDVIVTPQEKESNAGAGAR
jgi:hypothetical protein